MIIIISMVTLDLSKLSFYSNWENRERRDGVKCVGIRAANFHLPSIQSLALVKKNN